jgi:hypothetical protein
MFAHQALPQAVVAIVPPGMTTGEVACPFFANLAISAAALRRRSATET